MSLARRLEPELLDQLPADDPRAMRSRRDLTRINGFMANAGAMAAALRFVFQPGGPLALWRGDVNDDAYFVQASSLGATLRDPRFLIFFGAWLGLNLIIGLGSVPFGEEGQQIAWQAHIGGFVAGLLLFNIFDPVGRRDALDARRKG